MIKPAEAMVLEILMIGRVAQTTIKKFKRTLNRSRTTMMDLVTLMSGREAIMTTRILKMIRKMIKMPTSPMLLETVTKKLWSQSRRSKRRRLLSRSDWSVKSLLMPIHFWQVSWPTWVLVQRSPT